MSYHFNVKFVSRGKGQSLVAKGAYQARDKFREERTGELKDYTYKADRPVASFVFIDKKHGAELQDNEKLLNAIDARENQKNSQTGLNFIGALPDKLTDEERARMVRDFGREQFFRKGIAAVAHIHRPSEQGDDRNHHVHILAATRTMGADGKFGEKFITWDNYDKQLEQWREKWADIGARYLEKAGHHQEAERWRYGHLKNELQRDKALERCDMEWAEEKAKEASTKRGLIVDAMERRGEETERGNIHRDTNERNAQHYQTAAELKREFAEIQKAITQEERIWAEQQRAEQQRADHQRAEQQHRAEQQRAAALVTETLLRGTLPRAHQQEPASDQRKTAAPQLGKIAGEIRLAYSLTSTGQEFVNAIEDRGLTFSEMREADAERLNRWERQRLRELAAAAPTVPPAHAPQPTEIDAKAKPLTRQDAWMAQTGGVDALSPELLDSAQQSYDKWGGNKEKYNLANYVGFVQDKERERRESGQQQEQDQPPKEYERYKVGELVVVDQYGNIHQLSARNTGDDAKGRAEHLKDIDRAALLSVTAAQGAMKEFRLHQQQERPEIQAQPPAERAADIKPLRGPAIDMRFAYRTNDSPKAYAASLADRGILLAVVTKHEAEESRKQAEAAKAAGRFPNATGLKENEIVAVNQRGHVQRFTERITGSSFGDMQAYLRNLDRSQFSGGIEETRRYVRGRIDEENRLQKDRDRTAKSILGMLNFFDAGYTTQSLSHSLLDGVQRRTIENERAASRPRNTRDR